MKRSEVILSLWKHLNKEFGHHTPVTRFYCKEIVEFLEKEGMLPPVVNEQALNPHDACYWENE